MKRIRRFAGIGIAAVLFATALTGCGPKSASSSGEGGMKKIRIGTQPTTIGVPVQYAYEKGYFKAEGLDVEIVLFPTGAPLNEAIAAGELDVAANGLASVFPLANGVCDWIGEGNTTGGMGIYVREGSPLLQHKGEIPGKPNMYGSADTIKGLTFLGPLGTSAQFNVMRYIQQFGLTDADIQQIHMDHGQAYQAFMAGEGDALASSPPFTYDAEKNGCVLAASFEDATDSPLFDGLIVRKDYEADHHDEIVSFVKAYYRACDDFMKDPSLRKSFSMKWFTANGREYSEETMDREIQDRAYVTKDMMTQPDYAYGKGMLAIADFYTSDGKVDKNDLDKVPASFNLTYIKEALGLDNVKTATYADVR